MLRAVRLIILLPVLVLYFSCSSAVKSSQPEPAAMAGHDMHHMHSTGRGFASDSSLDDMDMVKLCNNNFTATVSTAHQTLINTYFANHQHRMDHALWHAMRSGLNATQLKEVTTAFGQTWVPQATPQVNSFHPLCTMVKSSANAAGSYPGGEDFLYMHHGMIKMLQAAFVENSLPCIQPWLQFSDIQNAPLAPNSKISGPKAPAALAQLGTWDAYLQNSTNLANMSLGQLGIAIEFTIHNNLHMRFATDAPPSGFKGDGAQIPYNNILPPNWPYDNPAYNWLADPYGAAVNPVFWKIHGYVDHFIKMWMTAHGYAYTSTACPTGTTTPGSSNSCYQWAGTWVGDPNLFNETSATPTDQDLAMTAEFNKIRMSHQRVGVIQDEDLKSGKFGAAAPPSDPFSTALQGLGCNSNEDTP